MKQNIRNAVIVKRSLYIIIGLLIIGLFIIPDANAAGLGRLETNLKGKIKDVIKVIETLCIGGFGIGFLWVVISLLKGEPNYRYGMVLVAAGGLLFCASQITQWLVS